MSDTLGDIEARWADADEGPLEWAVSSLLAWTKVNKNTEIDEGIAAVAIALQNGPQDIAYLLAELGKERSLRQTMESERNDAQLVRPHQRKTHQHRGDLFTHRHRGSRSLWQGLPYRLPAITAAGRLDATRPDYPAQDVERLRHFGRSHPPGLTQPVRSDTTCHHTGLGWSHGQRKTPQLPAPALTRTRNGRLLVRGLRVRPSRRRTLAGTPIHCTRGSGGPETGGWPVSHRDDERVRQVAVRGVRRGRR